MKASEIMTTHVVRLSPDCTIGEAVRRFEETNFQSFPIVDEKGILIGTLNIWRILRKVIPPYIASGQLTSVRFAPELEILHERLGLLRSKPVTTIMNKNPPVIRSDCSVLECATVMVNAPKKIHVLPVVDEHMKLLGIVTPFDLIKEID